MEFTILHTNKYHPNNLLTLNTYFLKMQGLKYLLNLIMFELVAGVGAGAGNYQS